MNVREQSLASARRDVLFAVDLLGEVQIAELVDDIDLTRGQVIAALRFLVDAELVGRDDGRTVTYWIRDHGSAVVQMIEAS